MNMQSLWPLALILTSLFSSDLLAQSEIASVQNKTEQSFDKDKPLSVNDIPLILQKFKSESLETREHILGKVSEAYLEDAKNPALKLENMWVNDKGTLLELSGLRRSSNKYSAVIDLATLQLLNLKSNDHSKYLTHIGGNEVGTENSKTLLQLQPGERLFLFFDSIDDLQPHSLRYTNLGGKTDNYFDRIDPLFKNRYDKAYEKASNRESSVEDMKLFLMEFALTDSEKRAQKIFVDLITKLRSLNTFDGYFQAYQLVKDPTDERLASKLARSSEQQSKLAAAVEQVKQAESIKQEKLRLAQEAKFEEIRKRDEARAAESRKQEEVKQVQMKAANAAASAADDEARCMRTPTCRAAWQAEQARCVSQIQSCRGNCDRVSGSGGYSSWISNLVAAGISRACYGACKCGSGFGDLLGKFNDLASENTSRSRPTQISPTKQDSAQSDNKTPTTTQRIRSHRTDNLEHIFVRCANSGKERNYQFNRDTGRYCTPGALSCGSEEWVIRAICN